MKNWQKYLLLTSSIALTIPVAKFLNACAGGEDPYDYFASFFLNDINRDPAYQSFRFTSYLTYYDEWWDSNTDADTALADENVAAWQIFLGTGVPRADIDSFVYRFSYTDLKALYQSIEKNTPATLPKAVANNGMTKWFRDQRDLEALGYLMYAKQCEPQVSGADAWDTPERDSLKMTKLIKNGLQLHAAAKQDFFRWRYAFQVMRLAFYSGQNQKTLELYEELIGNKTGAGYIYARVLGLKAGAMYRTGKKQQAAYLYSKVFDLSDDRKRSAHISFNWAVNANSQKVIPLCKNDHEKAVVYIMDGLYNSESDKQSMAELMQQAYKLDPAIRGLDVVMTRAINQLEAAFLDEKLRAGRNIYALNGYGYYNDSEIPTPNQDRSPEFRRELKNLADFAGSVARAGNNGSPAFWYLAQAYVQLLNQNNSEAYSSLQQAEKLKLTQRQKDQANIIRALYYVYQKPTLTAASEADLLPLLQWLQTAKQKDQRLEKVYNYLLNGVLASAYLKQKDTTKMVLSLSKLSSPQPFGVQDYGDGYTEAYAVDFTDEAGSFLQTMSMAQLQQTKNFVLSGGSNGFEKWLISNNLYSPSVLSEMEGTRYLRMLDFANAVKAFQQVKKEELKERLLPDPFVLHLRDVQRWDRHDSANSYTKLRFAQEMAQLSQQANSNRAEAAQQFLYGLGLYSMTYYGRASHAFTYYRSGSDGRAYYASEDRKRLRAGYQNYYSVQEAAKYFEAAARNATDPELKAKATYMLAMCWQKNIQPRDAGKNLYDYNGKEYYQDALKNPYFAALKEMNGTGFYKEAVTRCTYLRDYVKRRR